MTTFQHTSNLEKSDIRIFCDDDTRWQKRDIALGGYEDMKKYAEGYLFTIRNTLTLAFHSYMICDVKPLCKYDKKKEPIPGFHAATYWQRHYLPKGGRSFPVDKIQVEHQLTAYVHLEYHGNPRRDVITVSLPLLPVLFPVERLQLTKFYRYVVIRSIQLQPTEHPDIRDTL
jgi:hypothetical protein